MNKRTDDFYMADSFDRAYTTTGSTIVLNNCAAVKGVEAIDALGCVKADSTISWEPMSACIIANGELSVSEANSYVTKDALQRVTDKVAEMAKSIAELKKSFEAPYSKPLRALRSELRTLDARRYNNDTTRVM